MNAGPVYIQNWNFVISNSGLTILLNDWSDHQSVIMTSGNQWSIMKINDLSFSIMEKEDTVHDVLSEIVNIYIFCR